MLHDGKIKPDMQTCVNQPSVTMWHSAEGVRCLKQALTTYQRVHSSGVRRNPHEGCRHGPNVFTLYQVLCIGLSPKNTPYCTFTTPFGLLVIGLFVCHCDGTDRTTTLWDSLRKRAIPLVNLFYRHDAPKYSP